MRFLALIICFQIFIQQYSFSQGCCSGGSGSPIAGGASAGVLLDRQMEVASVFQHINSNKFLVEDRDTSQLFDNYNSNYIYSKIGYGITKDLTLSIETGYFLNKTQTELFDTVLNKQESKKSKGIADLIIFPRYDIYNHTSEKSRVELTLGLGYKIPLGSHTDSVFTWFDSTLQIAHYTIMPPLVQPTNGSHDLLFYSFFYRGFPVRDFRLFANVFYIRKGWNSLGAKFGDYASLGLFAGKSFKKLGITLQLKGERIGKMKAAKNVDLQAFYNIDTASTGSRKISFAPQISYIFKAVTVFALSEFPLYEFMNGAQSASQYQITAGFSYRFFAVKSKIPKEGEDIYGCSMNCEGGQSNKPGKCRICGMEMEKKK